MRQELEVRNSLDENLNPAGGFVYGVGLNIVWQDGPLGRGEDRKEPNGAFVEDVIWAALKRLEFYQSTKFNCFENGAAIDYLLDALAVLNSRTARRETENTEGTHEGN